MMISRIEWKNGGAREMQDRIVKYEHVLEEKQLELFNRLAFALISVLETFKRFVHGSVAGIRPSDQRISRLSRGFSRSLVNHEIYFARYTISSPRKWIRERRNVSITNARGINPRLDRPEKSWKKISSFSIPRREREKLTLHNVRYARINQRVNDSSASLTR